jgi:hypothetical protein
VKSKIHESFTLQKLVQMDIFLPVSLNVVCERTQRNPQPTGLEYTFLLYSIVGVGIATVLNVSNWKLYGN